MTVEKTDQVRPQGGFVQEVKEAWSAMPNKGLFVSLLWVWVLLFEFVGNSTFGYIQTHSLYTWTFWAWDNPDDEHGYLVPFLVLGLFWWKRAQFSGITARPWMGGFGLVAVALMLHVFGYLAQQTRISQAAFYLGLYALIGLSWGPQALARSFFPMCLLAFALPLGTLAESITFPLRLMATTITTVVAGNVLGINVIQSGTQIFEPNGAFQYEVAAACGGLRSLTAVLALCTIFGFMNFNKWPRRLTMIAAAFPLAIAGNVCRLLLIIAVAEAFGRDWGQWVHDNSVLSLVPYVPPIIGIGLLGRFLTEKRKPSAPAAPDGLPQSTLGTAL
jgi:exosortase